jgi:cell wall-associated NlpC family hydrolase
MFVKFRAGGRTVEEGLDCYGLCKEIYKRLGKSLPEYDIITEDVKIIDNVVEENKGKFIRLDYPVPFCLVLFSIIPPYESHIGVVLEDRRSFIHMQRNKGCCVESLNNRFWVNRIRGFYEWKEFN